VSKYKQNCATHIESNHVNHAGVFCDLCSKKCPTRDALRKHRRQYHVV
jgi:hypothetical protein